MENQESLEHVERTEDLVSKDYQEKEEQKENLVDHWKENPFQVKLVILAAQVAKVQWEKRESPVPVDDQD